MTSVNVYLFLPRADESSAEASRDIKGGDTRHNFAATKQEHLLSQPSLPLLQTRFQTNASNLNVPMEQKEAPGLSCGAKLNLARAPRPQIGFKNFRAFPHSGFGLKTTEDFLKKFLTIFYPQNARENNGFQ